VRSLVRLPETRWGLGSLSSDYVLSDVIKTFSLLVLLAHRARSRWLQLTSYINHLLLTYLLPGWVTVYGQVNLLGI